MNSERLEINQEDLLNIISSLESHQAWLKNSNEGAKANFMHVNFKNFNFSKFDISYIVFKNCVFDNANLNNKSIIEAEFHNCDLAGASFKADEINSVLFENSNLSSVLFAKSHFINCVFRSCFSLEANFIKTTFQKCSFFKANFQLSDFNSCEFYECQIEDVNFALTDFINSVAVKSKFKNIVFTGVDMSEAKYKVCSFVETSFTSFKKKNGNAIKTSLKDTIFEDCGLSKCFFEEKKEFVQNRIKKTKTNHNLGFEKIHKNIFYYLKGITSLFLLAIIVLILNNKITPISALVLGICSSAFIFIKTLILNKFSSLQTNPKIQFILGIFFATLVFVAFFSNWLFSLKYQNFNLSASLLMLFSLSVFNIVFYIKILSYNNKLL